MRKFIDEFNKIGHYEKESRVIMAVGFCLDDDPIMHCAAIAFIDDLRGAKSNPEDKNVIAQKLEEHRRRRDEIRQGVENNDAETTGDRTR